MNFVFLRLQTASFSGTLRTAFGRLSAQEARKSDEMIYDQQDREKGLSCQKVIFLLK